MGVLRVAFLSGLVLELAASVSTAMVAAAIGVRLIEGVIGFEAGLVALLLTPEFYLPFRQLGQRHHAGMEGVAASEGIFSLVDAAPPRRAPRRAVSSVPSTATIELNRVTCQYPDADAPALEEVSLALRPGRVVALAGPSGAGKSTLLAALLRFIEPTAGRLTLNGVPSTELDPADWRRHIAYVPQRPRFVHGSILENLRAGHAAATMSEVAEAVRLADAEDVIASRPEGYGTILDEAASSFSGGERQRLAIARALVKGAPVLLLDEPTSSLDADAEASIAETLRRVGATRTVLVATHRPRTIAAADVIVVLDNGRIRTCTPVEPVLDGPTRRPHLDEEVA
jgi:ABC-type transport system involved in cytochrome bd biosynthesis fused ATPase/permease subunit